MRAAVARGVMALAIACLGRCRQQWGLAMQGEFEAAAEEGKPLIFAFGCLFAAVREMPTHEEGRFVLTNYVFALGLMMPMATLQIGCALLGFPYLYPGQDGLRGAMAAGGVQESLLRGVYQAAVPSLSVLLLLLGIGHLRIAWVMLEGDWSRVTAIGTRTMAAAATLVIFMAALFLDGSQAVLQTAVLALELAILSLLARWHAQLFPSPSSEELAR